MIKPMSSQEILALDHAHVWHPYAGMGTDVPVYPVEAAHGVHIELADGKTLVDGMSSWWCAIHGYNHPQMNAALQQQLTRMAHIMFGGLTHQPAVQLAAKLVELTPAPLQSVFFSDSGSVSVEVAMKMAIQYWHALQQPDKQHFLTLRSGYHGDTFGAMSVCDPVTGMHSLFSDALQQQFFVPSPECLFGQECTEQDLLPMRQMLTEHAHEIAGVILEPIVQGAGGMRFYSADYLAGARSLCNEFQVLLIADEIATGLGRTGKLFACEHANISPDIMCVGKALTGGYLTLAATITSETVSSTISEGEPGIFMHGPTFMANPLACSAGLASLELLLDSSWEERIKSIAQQLLAELAPCAALEQVLDVRVLGAIGVVELHQPVDMRSIQQAFVDEGVWVRPFGRLIYLMPPYIISAAELRQLTHATVKVISRLK